MVMEKKFKIFLIISVSLLFMQGAFTLIWVTGKEKTAYINTEEVYNNFEMKKGLEAQLKNVQDARQHLLDSLKLQLDMMSIRLQQNEKDTDSLLFNSFSDMRDAYFKKQEEFKESNEILAQKYTDQVWIQLNQYMKDFGHQNEYRYIFGATGDGALMFADDAVNITVEVQGYVNDRFKGQP